MVIKRFSDLQTNERKELYDFISSFGPNHYFSTYDGMIKNYSGIIYNYGDSFFSLWHKGRIKGTLGVITKEIPEKGEGFINGINIREKDKDYFNILLQEGINFCENMKSNRIKLGIKAYLSFLKSIVEDNGFTEAYSSIIMKLIDEENENFKPIESEQIRFESVTENNKYLFKKVHDNAFINSPNGSTITEEELKGILDRNKDDENLAGICFLNNNAAGIYELKIKDNIGWIEALGVDPKYQEKGLGKLILKKSIEILKEKNVNEIKLFVMSSNEKAFNLYKMNGFIIEEATSTWYQR